MKNTFSATTSAITTSQEKDPLVIIGAGFAGTTALLHILIKAASDPVLSGHNPINIKLIERHEKQLYGGIAYGQIAKSNLNLNLSSRRITPFAKGKEPEGFPSFEDFIEEFGKTNPEALKQLNNTNRQLYGSYLRHLVGIALEKAGPKVSLETIYDQVIDLEETPNGVHLSLNGSQEIKASHVILASGLNEATKPAFAFNSAGHPAYLNYPYGADSNAFFDSIKADAETSKNKKALVIGTGLSAIDSVIRLLDSGFKGKISMMSRRGLMHAVYRETDSNPRNPLDGEPRDEDGLAFTKKPPAFLDGLDKGQSFNVLFKHARREMGNLLKKGYTSEEILSHWEKYFHLIYQRFPKETSVFLGRYETVINVMRVGTTPELAQKIEAAVKSGQLEILAARIQEIKPKNNEMNVTYRRNNKHGRSGEEYTTAPYDFVINGIGNSTKYDLKPDDIADPLWRALRERNAYEVHPLRDGVAVTNSFHLRNGDGTPYNRVAVIGVPISGHMNVTPYPYPEKSGTGARLGAFTLNIQGVLGGVLGMIEAQYEQIRNRQINPPQQTLKTKPKKSPPPSLSVQA